MKKLLLISTCLLSLHATHASEYSMKSACYRKPNLLQQYVYNTYQWGKKALDPLSKMYEYEEGENKKELLDDSLFASCKKLFPKLKKISIKIVLKFEKVREELGRYVVGDGI